MSLRSNNIAEFRAVLRAANNIIVVAGAGLSAASGIPTFRGSGGMWRSLDAISLATPEAFEANPSLVWQFYHYRREKALQANPNAAHIALAKLMTPSVLSRVAPAAKSFHLITQNVDGLSTRALRMVHESQTQASVTSPVPEADIPNPASLIEMHGRLFDVRCTECNHSVPDFTSPLCPALKEADDQHANVIQAGHPEHEINIPIEKLPRCTNCGSLTRPDVVWFGEEIPLLPQIDQLVDEADLCLVVGTSSVVYPAAGFASDVLSNGGSVAVFNVEPVEDDVQFMFVGGCEVELPKALGLSVDE
ncbi:hypothetical protein FRC18_005005 [Serendipita sp. 400]|nr:hypothetical protein FRC18_005005 [Serendipita sp. 400]